MLQHPQSVETSPLIRRLRATFSRREKDRKCCYLLLDFQHCITNLMHMIFRQIGVHGEGEDAG